METDKTNLRENAAKAATGIKGVLMRCGLSETAARWVANLTVGAAVIAAITAGVLTVTGCTASMKQEADGSWSYSGIIVLPVKSTK